jgi:hypothetical protein
MSGALARLARSSPELARSFSDDLPESSFLQLCVQSGHVWRDRLLGPVVTLRLFLLQILHGNTAITHLRHLSGMAFAAGSYCDARARLPLAALQALLQATMDSAAALSRADRLLGGRVLFVDASSFSMPDTKPLREHFGLQRSQKPGVGYPVGKIMGLLDAVTGLFVKVIAYSLFTHDMRGVIGVHAWLQTGDILVGDRAFCSFVHFCLLSSAGVFGCFRLHQRRKFDRLGIVRWKRPRACPAWMTSAQFKSLPPWIEVRLVEHRIEQAGFRTKKLIVATTLLDAQSWSDQRVAELYGRRWEIETCFNHLKTSMKMNVLKCETVEGVMKELCIYLLVYNLVRLTMLRWAMMAGVDVRRVSFIDAWRRLAAWALGLPGIDQLIVNPLRPGRAHPRAVRRRPKKYTLLTTPRHEPKSPENKGKTC